MAAPWTLELAAKGGEGLVIATELVIAMELVPTSVSG